MNTLALVGWAKNLTARIKFFVCSSDRYADSDGYMDYEERDHDEDNLCRELNNLLETVSNPTLPSVDRLIEVAVGGGLITQAEADSALAMNDESLAA